MQLSTDKSDMIELRTAEKRSRLKQNMTLISYKITWIILWQHYFVFLIFAIMYILCYKYLLAFTINFSYTHFYYYYHVSNNNILIILQKYKIYIDAELSLQKYIGLG